MTLHAAELLGRQEAQQLLDHLGKNAPKLVEDLVPKLLSLASVQKVLQNLLDEGVHIRDMRTIIETLCRACRARAGSARTHRAGARGAGPRDRAADLRVVAANCR